MKERTEAVKAFLTSAREVGMELARHRGRVQQLELRCRKVTTAGPGGFGGGSYDSADGLLAMLCDARDEEVRAMAREQEKLRAIGDFIDRLEGADVLRMILRLRYLEYLNWAGVRRAMEKAGVWYSERQILRLHGKALEAAAALWEAERAA